MVLDGYIRVSRVGKREGNSFISPDVQRDQIEGWARRQGAQVAHVFEELDQSGGRRDRPLLEAALGRIEHGESQGIVVAYLSRFGRSLLDGLSAIQRIRDAGGTFVSVQEGLDLSTDTGRLILRVMFSIAEWELDRTRTNWLIARERAVARGIGAPTPPFGYRRGPQKRLVVDPVEGPLVHELFERRAASASIAELCDFLAAAGARTSQGRSLWRPQTVRKLLANRVYRGEVHHSGFSKANAHPALVDEPAWQRAQESVLHRTLDNSPEIAMLRGILRCAGCQRPLGTDLTRRGTSYESRRYFCNPILLTAPCPAPADIRDAKVEPHIEQIFWQELEHPTGKGSGRLERLEAEVERRERELATYRDNATLPVRIGPQRFAQGLTVRQARLDRAQSELSRGRLRHQWPNLPPPAQLREQWPSMSLRERRDAIAEVIECAFVHSGRGPADSRLFICRRGQSPPDLPTSHPRKPFATHPFDPDACEPPLRLRRSEPDWESGDLRGELERFLDGRDRWPGFAEFQRAGRATLHGQVSRRGGPRAWAAITGRRWEPYQPFSNRSVWSRERVENELRDYLRGRSKWPTYLDFDQDGKRQLRRALRWYDTPESWARTFGLDLTASQRSRNGRSYEQLFAEMAEFSAGRSDWPRRAEFTATGRGQLYEEIVRQHMDTRLAADLRLKLSARKRPWTDDKIKEALDGFLDGRDFWPSRKEFAAAGLRGLHATLQRRQVQDEWAARYGLERIRSGGSAKETRSASEQGA
jgi:site-specific DNA recombinase